MLSAGQVEQFHRDGFLLFPELFSRAEVGILDAELQRIRVEAAATVPLEDRESSGALRQLRQFHEPGGSTSSAAFQALARLPRVLEPARQVLGDDDLYVFQSKVNTKTAIDGSHWMWHQDFPNWQLDGVPAPNMATCLVMLDEATEMSGALYLVPGSHRLGTLDQEDTTGLPRRVVPKLRMIEILESHRRPVAVTGKPGTAALFHANIVHSSGHNLSGQDRRQIYVVYNPVANQAMGSPSARANSFSRNATLLAPVSDEALLLSATKFSHITP